MKNNQPNESNWYLLTGLIFGIAIGLVISLLIYPKIDPIALPSELSWSESAAYREKIALAYIANPDMQRAVSRLELLQDPDPVDALITQAQEVVATGGSDEIARALATLATALSQLP